MNCRNRSSVGIAAGATRRAEPEKGGPGVGGGTEPGAAVAPESAEGGARVPKSALEGVEPLEAVDLLKPLGPDPLATPTVAALYRGAQRQDEVISQRGVVEQRVKFLAFQTG